MAKLNKSDHKGLKIGGRIVKGVLAAGAIVGTIFAADSLKKKDSDSAGDKDKGEKA